MSNIDESLKKEVLYCLCNMCLPEQNTRVDLQELLDRTGVDWITLDAALKVLDAEGYISDLNSRQTFLSLIVNLETFRKFGY